MARDIDLTQPLSDGEKQYLIDRERWRDLEINAEHTGDAVPDRNTGLSAQAASARLGDQTVTQVPDGSNPAPASLGQRQRAAATGGAVQIQFETDDRSYEDWSKQDLQEQAERRGLTRSGSKQALADRLRAWDEENREEDTTGDNENPEPEDEDTDDDADENGDDTDGDEDDDSEDDGDPDE